MDPCQNGRENEHIAETMYLYGAEYGNERSRPGRRMQAMGDLQNRNCCGDGHCPRKPDMRSNRLVRSDADTRGHQLTDDEVSRLCKIGMRSSVQQCSRRSE